MYLQCVYVCMYVSMMYIGLCDICRYGVCMYDCMYI